VITLDDCFTAQCGRLQVLESGNGMSLMFYQETFATPIFHTKNLQDDAIIVLQGEYLTYMVGLSRYSR